MLDSGTNFEFTDKHNGFSKVTIVSLGLFECWEFFIVTEMGNAGERFKQLGWCA